MIRAIIVMVMVDETGILFNGAVGGKRRTSLKNETEFVDRKM
jgi:hypothetical protein